MLTIRKWSLLLCGILPLVIGNGCSSSNSSSGRHGNNYENLGRFVASYDAETQSFSIRSQADPANRDLDRYALNYDDNSTIIEDQGPPRTDCYITSTSINEINPCVGLVDPDSCTSDWNPTTKILSFYAKIINKTSNTYYNDTDYTFLNGSADHDVTFYAPFYFKLIEVSPVAPATDGLVTAINTNLPDAECGGDGLDLQDVNDDSNGDDRFDCIYPEQAFDPDDDPVDPGWNFTPFVTGSNMTPGEDSGCALFMQFTLSELGSFDLVFDLLAVRDDGSLPSTPNVTSHSDGDYVNTNPITVAGNNCVNGATVYVEGGPSTYSGLCSSGSFSISTTLNANQVNNLSVYQIDTFQRQSAADTLSITHDNVAPTVLSASPANGETQVDVNVNCHFTFSEAMDTTTFSTGTTCSNGTFTLCRGTTFLAGSIAFADNDTQAIYTPTTKPLNTNASHSCTATTGVTDLAGNAVAANYVSTFTTAPTGSEYTDTIPPSIRFAIPYDNSITSPNSAVVIYFNEAIDPTTINNVDATCSNALPNLVVYDFPNGGCSGAGAVAGSFSLNGNGTIATFNPTSPPFNSTSTYMLVAQGCVKDLSGNALPNRQNLAACGIHTFNYNILQFFSPAATADTTAPSLAYVGPVTDATSVPQPVFPFMIFNEPLDPATVISDYFFLNKSGIPSPLPASVVADPTLQLIEFQPGSVLNTTSTAVHALTATGAVTDLSGNQMISPQTSQFTVTSTADTAAPTVASVAPTNVVGSPASCGTAGNYVSKCTSFDVTFSEPMDVSTLNTANVELINFNDGSCSATMKKPAALEISDDGLSVRITPVSSMRSGGACSGNRRRYYVQVSNVKDRAGNSIAATYQSIVYSACVETTVPTVNAVVPATGGTIPANGNWAIFFSEAIDKSTLINSNFVATSCLPFIRSSSDGSIVVMNCYGDLPSNGAMTVVRNVRDYYNGTNNASCEASAGNQMAANQVTTFSVGAVDTTPPTISNLSDVSPQDQSTGVSTAVTPSVTFSEAIDPLSVLATSVFLTDAQGNRVNAMLSFSADAKTVTITPNAALVNNTIYYIIATTAVRDLGGSLNYDGSGGESTSWPNVLRACFGTGTATCS